MPAFAALAQSHALLALLCLVACSHEDMSRARKHASTMVLVDTLARLRHSPLIRGAKPQKGADMTRAIAAQMVKVSAPGEMTGDELRLKAMADLNIWGGMSHSIEPDDEGNVSFDFDPSTIKGGLPALFAWLDNLGTEYTATFIHWLDD